jgi:hypothetical protein
MRAGYWEQDSTEEDSDFDYPEMVQTEQDKAWEQEAHNFVNAFEAPDREFIPSQQEGWQALWYAFVAGDVETAMAILISNWLEQSYVLFYENVQGGRGKPFRMPCVRLCSRRLRIGQAEKDPEPLWQDAPPFPDVVDFAQDKDPLCPAESVASAPVCEGCERQYKEWIDMKTGKIEMEFGRVERRPGPVGGPEFVMVYIKLRRWKDKEGNLWEGAYDWWEEQKTGLTPRIIERPEARRRKRARHKEDAQQDFLSTRMADL